MIDIYIDDGISRDWFFVSLPINKKESLSFDWTTKGHRILLQKLVKKEPRPLGSPAMEWDTIHIRGRKFIKKEHAVWYDMGKKDWVNGQVYEIVKEWPMNAQLAEKLLNYSLLVRDHIFELRKYAKEIGEFEKLLLEEKLHILR